MNENNEQLRIIADVLAEENNVNAKYIFRNDRTRAVTDLRAIFFYFASRYSTCSLAGIGRFSLKMGRPKPHNHATVIYNIQKVKTLIEYDKGFREKVSSLESALQFHVDYQQLKEHESSNIRKSVIEKVHHETDLNFLAAYSQLTELIFKNKYLLAELTDMAVDYENKNKDERIYQTSPQDS